MSALQQLVADARAAGEPDRICQVVPFARFLGLELVELDGQLTTRMPFAERLIGNPSVPALHGGAVGTLLETTAILTTIWTMEEIRRPRTITLTVDYLRPAFPELTLARAEVLRAGRRVTTLLARAWQSDPGKPVAAAKVHLMIS